MSVPILNNIYGFMKKLGFIDQVPSNLEQVSHDLYILNDIHHYIYMVVSNKTLSRYKKEDYIRDLGIFDQNQINQILNNEQKIIAPIEYIHSKRWGDKVTVVESKKSGGAFFKSRHPTPDISILDWVFFPLWSIENAPLIGPFAGIPLDFISITLANMDIYVKTSSKLVDELRQPAIQAAMSVFSASTAGVGLAITPFIAPAINKATDLLVHIVAHSIDTINMFYNINRKNFGLSYLLLMEIVPPLNEFMDKLINYMVIGNRAMRRNIRFIEMFIDGVDAYEEVVRSLMFPQAILYRQLAPYKENLSSLHNKVAKFPVGEVPIVSNVAGVIRDNIAMGIQKIENGINTPQDYKITYDIPKNY
jgi:hypothetical protein